MARMRCRCGLYYETYEWDICPACGSSLSKGRRLPDEDDVRAEMEAELQAILDEHNSG